VFTTEPLTAEAPRVPIIRQFDMKLDYVKWLAHVDDPLPTQTIGVDVDPVVLLVSYQDAMLMSRVAATLTPPTKAVDAVVDDDVSVEEEIDGNRLLCEHTQLNLWNTTLS
jgi:hypothetical protein